MKLQNTEMEFITFDAQDVIVTSGHVYSAKVRFSGETVIAYHATDNDELAGFKFGSSSAAGNLAQNLERIYGYNAENQKLSNDYWVADGTQYYSSGEKAAGSDISDYELLSTVKAIVGWLKDYGYLQ